MDSEQLAADLVDDLARSCWVIETARSSLYRGWAGTDPRYEQNVDICHERAHLIEASLNERSKRPDHELVDGHLAWMTSVAGDDPEEVPLAPFFIDRLGLWVDSHLPRFIGGGGRLVELGEKARAELRFPESFPPPPPYEPVRPVEVEPPGEITFRFGILADLHFGSARAADHARAAIEDLNASGAELVVQLGDLTDKGDRDEYEAATQALAQLDCPFVTMMGNHDVFSFAEEQLLGKELYAEKFGRAPDGVVLEHKGVKFCVLDSVEHAASPFPGFDFTSGSFADGPGGAIVRGALSPPQHDLLADVAAPGGGPAFVFLHHPPQPFPGFPPILFGLRDIDSGRLHATIDSGNVWGVFAGHTHRNFRTRDYDGVPAHEVGIPRDFPFGYALVDVTDAGYAYRFMQLSDEELVSSAYETAGHLWRRYALGDETARGFTFSPA
ncbi:MAG: metallophosphoesterase [Actinobacteria bacterium]|nr:metallophosphoesterase [Actinomycetota bacterium]